MQTTKFAHEALEQFGQFDALGALAQDTGSADLWVKPLATANAPISRWWIRNGRPVVADVAAARDTTRLAEMAFSFETWAPRLA